MSRLHAVPEGAGRYDNLHGDEDQTLDVEPSMDRALEEVVETVMLFAQYPQPNPPGSKRAQPRVRFDLYEYLDEKYDRAELVEMVVGFLTSYGSDLGNLQQREGAKLEKMLEQELAGGEIVRDRAEDLANEEREAA